LFIFSKLLGESTSSNPSILYDATPLFSAFMYSCPSFSSSSNFLLFSTRLLICDPAGLSSPAIFAFFISISDIVSLYVAISSRLFVASIFSIYPSICLSRICISAE